MLRSPERRNQLSDKLKNSRVNRKQPDANAIHARIAHSRYLRQRQARASAGREGNHWVTQTLEPLLEELRRCAAGSYQCGPGV